MNWRLGGDGPLESGGDAIEAIEEVGDGARGHGVVEGIGDALERDFKTLDCFNVTVGGADIVDACRGVVDEVEDDLDLAKQLVDAELRFRWEHDVLSKAYHFGCAGYF